MQSLERLLILLDLIYAASRAAIDPNRPGLRSVQSAVDPDRPGLRSVQSGSLSYLICSAQHPKQMLNLPDLVCIASGAALKLPYFVALGYESLFPMS
jgi:hypothetical protein